MEEGNGVNQDKKEQNELYNQDKDRPTNLLDNFSPEKNLNETQNSNLLQPDLNLGLSLGSIYGENSKENPLIRSSSIAGIVTLTNTSGEGERSSLSLERASSLPTVAEQQQRPVTLRELQTMRRIEAKNRLIQKQRSSKEAKQKEKFPAPQPMPSSPSEVPAWAAASAANSPALCRAILKIQTQGLSGNKRGAEGSAAPNAPCAPVEDSVAPDAPSRVCATVEGSVTPNAPSRVCAPVEGSVSPNAPSRFHAPVEGSAAGNAPCRFCVPVEGSAAGNAPSRFLAPVEGSVKPSSPPSSFKFPPTPKNAETVPVVTSATTSSGTSVKPAETKPEIPYKRARTYHGNFEDDGVDVMRQMPTVSTTGEGPDGKRIEGFLYTYMRGHVCIVCVCHGSFLSPAEFVKHAGGKDVSNPMKRITVYSNFCS